MIIRTATAQTLRNVDLAPIVGPTFYESKGLMGIRILVDGAWKKIDSAFTAVSGQWKAISEINIVISNLWKDTVE